jgi:hypothetical protein
MLSRVSVSVQGLTQSCVSHSATYSFHKLPCPWYWAFPGPLLSCKADSVIYLVQYEGFIAAHTFRLLSMLLQDLLELYNFSQGNTLPMIQVQYFQVMENANWRGAMTRLLQVWHKPNQQTWVCSRTIRPTTMDCAPHFSLTKNFHQHFESQRYGLISCFRDKTKYSPHHAK